MIYIFFFNASVFQIPPAVRRNYIALMQAFNDANFKKGFSQLDSQVDMMYAIVYIPVTSQI